MIFFTQTSNCVTVATSLSHSNSRGVESSNREIKFDVKGSYVKRQTAKMTSEFVLFSSNPSLNHIKMQKCLLLFATNTNIFTLLFKELKTDGKSFIFAVLPFDVRPRNVKLMTRSRWKKNCNKFLSVAALLLTP